MPDLHEPDFSDRYFNADDGLKLHLRDYHPDEGRAAGRLPVICLPGLTRNARDFHPLAVILSRDPQTPRRVIAIDYRGRGLSARDENAANYNLIVEAQDVIRACAFLGIGRAVFIGTSRGGLILHILATMKPDLLAAVVLNDVGPVIEAEGLIQIRDDLNSATAPATWADAASTLKARHGRSFPALADDDWAAMATAIYRETDGRIAADVDPAIAAQLLQIDFSQPLADLWSQYAGFSHLPLMVIRGENSTLLSAATVAEMIDRHPGAQSSTAPGQGHPVLLHTQPVLADLRAFLTRLPA